MNKVKSTANFHWNRNNGRRRRMTSISFWLYLLQWLENFTIFYSIARYAYEFLAIAQVKHAKLNKLSDLGIECKCNLCFLHFVRFLCKHRFKDISILNRSIYSPFLLFSYWIPMLNWLYCTIWRNFIFTLFERTVSIYDIFYGRIQSIQLP